MQAGRAFRRPWGRRLAAALLPLLLTACQAKPAVEARPAMWLVADDDTRIYMLGTMHALPAGTDWDAGKVAAAIGQADTLMLELSPQQLAEAGAVFRDLAPREAPLAIGARLPAKALAGYRALEADEPFGGDGLDDWAVLVLMGQRVAQHADLSPADGVEAGLTAAFRRAGKPIHGLESAKAQLMLFERLDPATQRALLVRAAANIDHAEQDARAMAAAWSRGDAAALAKIVNEDVDAVPAARKALLTDRNRRWTAWVERRLDQPGTVLMAVGAGHLVGDDGVPTMLAAAGYKVVRVQ
ncbi:TraB/GumN family protein [Sphingopyxis sp.]|uniref:TraB/GumN family protein n=1 Tax=Sphingopyxis sp. TaxID=1908224 RepID=UPI002609A08A|nr:TraB/GumN family protein [Sphingopyxis sp.]MCW0199548.1 TraB/GumN family protein [Sphingopyxis sp.]